MDEEWMNEEWKDEEFKLCKFTYTQATMYIFDIFLLN